MVSKLFGGKSKSSTALNKFTPSNIDAGGITSSGKGTISIRSSAKRKNLFQSLSDTFKTQAGEIGALKTQLKPGFGSITNARVNTIRDRSRSAISDLSANLASRRIKGSSFGQDAISRAKAEFAREEADVRAQSFLEELDGTLNLINQETIAEENSIRALIENMNIELSVGEQLASQATSVLAANAQAQANAAAQESVGRGSFFGSLIGTGVKLYGISKGAG